MGFMLVIYQKQLSEKMERLFLIKIKIWKIFFINVFQFFLELNLNSNFLETQKLDSYIELQH